MQTQSIGKTVSCMDFDERGFSQSSMHVPFRPQWKMFLLIVIGDAL